MPLSAAAFRLAFSRSGLLALLAAAAGVLPAGGAPDASRPWDPSAPLPPFITHDFVDPANLIAIANYRSGTGHSFSDNYEPADRSLKNYFEPRSAFLNTRQSLPVFAPATGTLASVTAESQVLASGDHRGSQLSLSPDGFPAFEIRLFHVNLAAGLGVGSHVQAGDALGFADLRESVDFDWAVGAAWNAQLLFPDPGQASAAPGYRLLSPFDCMNDATFARYAAYGLGDRSVLVVPLAYRNAHPGTFAGQDLAHFDPIEFTVLLGPPDIAVQPVSQQRAAGADGFFAVVAQSQGVPLTYQWLLNGKALANGNGFAGATTAVLTVLGASAVQAGSYAVVVADAFGTTTSSAAALTVTSSAAGAPVITAQPAGQVVSPGANVTFAVTASGAGLAYQWFLNGAAVSGATESALTLNAVGSAQAGSYTVTVTNAAGSATSTPAVLVLLTAPTIGTQPASQTVTAGAAATFSVGATGSALSYQWFFNGTALSGATGSSLVLAGVNGSHVGSYTVVVTNSASSVTSSPAALTLAAATPAPTGGGGSGGGGGGGGGALSLWFYGAVGVLAWIGRCRRARLNRT